MTHHDGLLWLLKTLKGIYVTSHWISLIHFLRWLLLFLLIIVWILTCLSFLNYKIHIWRHRFGLLKSLRSYDTSWWAIMVIENFRRHLCHFTLIHFLRWRLLFLLIIVWKLGLVIYFNSSFPVFQVLLIYHAVYHRLSSRIFMEVQINQVK